MERLLEVASRVKSVREINEMTQGALAEMLGISRELISHYETGKRRIPISTLQKLADVFGLSLVDLLEMDLSMLKTQSRLVRFRANAIEEHDRVKLTEFNRIVKNYLKMQRLSGK